MPCYRPNQAYRTLETTSNDKRKIVFRKPEAYSYPLLLPCGQCIGCRLEHSLMWAIRCKHEAELHDQNSFITLTYSDEHLPWDGSLVKQHFQKFMKKLRRAYPQKTIRYYMCGEYGEKFTRPHYHANLFGIDFPDKEIHEENEGVLTYTSEQLGSLWGKGFATVMEFDFHTAAYTARYIMKKVNGDKKEQHYTTSCRHTGNLINLQPEYATMSRKPGLAKKWYQIYKTDVFPSDYLIHKNKKVKVPRYYDQLFESEEDIELIKIQRKKRAIKQKENNTPERLQVREKVKQLQLKQLERKYET